MDIRLSDLYELIVRIVDDRLKQRGDADSAFAVRGGGVSFSDSGEKSPEEEKALLQTLSEQVTKLVELQQQLLETVQASHRRLEALLSELLNLMNRQAGVSGVSDGHHRSVQPPSKVEGPNDEGDLEKRSGSNKSQRPRPIARRDETSSKGYAVMSPPDLSDEEISTMPSDNWLKEPSMQPAESELAPDGVSTPVVDESPPHTEVLPDQLSNYLRRLFGIDVDYLRARQNPSSPSLEDAQVFVGEGTYNGQPVTLTIFGKPHITPTDITVFYNAVVRPLRGSVTESVLSIVFGETFESKALKVAHALDLLVVNLKDLREVNDVES